MKFSELKIELTALGFRADFIGIEKTLIEAYLCRRCERNLIYKGFCTSDEARAYGVCGKCDSARRFFSNSPLIAEGLRRFSKRAV